MLFAVWRSCSVTDSPASQLAMLSVVGIEIERASL